MNTKPIPPFDAATIEAVAAILGETNQGLTNTQIEKLLAASNIRDPVTEDRAANPLVVQGLAYVSLSKRDRIARAIINNQVTRMADVRQPLTGRASTERILI